MLKRRKNKYGRLQAEKGEPVKLLSRKTRALRTWGDPNTSVSRSHAKTTAGSDGRWGAHSVSPVLPGKCLVATLFGFAPTASSSRDLSPLQSSELLSSPGAYGDGNEDGTGNRVERERVGDATGRGQRRDAGAPADVQREPQHYYPSPESSGGEQKPVFAPSCCSSSQERMRSVCPDAVSVCSRGGFLPSNAEGTCGGSSPWGELRSEEYCFRETDQDGDLILDRATKVSESPASAKSPRSATKKPRVLKFHGDKDGQKHRCLLSLTGCGGDPREMTTSSYSALDFITPSDHSGVVVSLGLPDKAVEPHLQSGVIDGGESSASARNTCLSRRRSEREPNSDTGYRDSGVTVRPGGEDTVKQKSCGEHERSHSDRPVKVGSVPPFERMVRERRLQMSAIGGVTPFKYNREIELSRTSTCHPLHAFDFRDEGTRSPCFHSSFFTQSSRDRLPGGTRDLSPLSSSPGPFFLVVSQPSGPVTRLSEVGRRLWSGGILLVNLLLYLLSPPHGRVSSFIGPTRPPRIPREMTADEERGESKYVCVGTEPKSRNIEKPDCRQDLRQCVHAGNSQSGKCAFSLRGFRACQSCTRRRERPPLGKKKRCGPSGGQKGQLCSGKPAGENDIGGRRHSVAGVKEVKERRKETEVLEEQQHRRPLAAENGQALGRGSQCLRRHASKPGQPSLFGKRLTVLELGSGVGLVGAALPCILEAADLGPCVEPGARAVVSGSPTAFCSSSCATSSGPPVGATCTCPLARELPFPGASPQVTGRTAKTDNFVADQEASRAREGTPAFSEQENDGVSAGAGSCKADLEVFLTDADESALQLAAYSILLNQAAVLSPENGGTRNTPDSHGEDKDNIRADVLGSRDPRGSTAFSVASESQREPFPRSAYRQRSTMEISTLSKKMNETGDSERSNFLYSRPRLHSGFSFSPMTSRRADIGTFSFCRPFLRHFNSARPVLSPLSFASSATSPSAVVKLRKLQWNRTCPTHRAAASDKNLHGRSAAGRTAACSVSPREESLYLCDKEQCEEESGRWVRNARGANTVDGMATRQICAKENALLPGDYLGTKARSEQYVRGRKSEPHQSTRLDKDRSAPSNGSVPSLPLAVSLTAPRVKDHSTRTAHEGDAVIGQVAPAVSWSSGATPRGFETAPVSQSLTPKQRGLARLASNEPETRSNRACSPEERKRSGSASNSAATGFEWGSEEEDDLFTCPWETHHKTYLYPGVLGTSRVSQEASPALSEGAPRRGTTAHYSDGNDAEAEVAKACFRGPSVRHSGQEEANSRGTVTKEGRTNSYATADDEAMSGKPKHTVRDQEQGSNAAGEKEPDERPLGELREGESDLDGDERFLVIVAADVLYDYGACDEFASQVARLMTIHTKQWTVETECSASSVSSRPGRARRKGDRGKSGTPWRAGRSFGEVKCFICHTRRVGFSCASSLVPVDVFAEYFRERFVRHILLQGEKHREGAATGKAGSHGHDKGEDVCGAESPEEMFEREGTHQEPSKGEPNCGRRVLTTETLSPQTTKKKPTPPSGVRGTVRSRSGKLESTRFREPQRDGEHASDSQTVSENPTSAGRVLGQKRKGSGCEEGSYSHPRRHPACLACCRDTSGLCTGCGVCCPGPPPWFDLVLHPQPPLRITPLACGHIDSSAFSWTAGSGEGEKKPAATRPAAEKTDLIEEAPKGTGLTEQREHAERGEISECDTGPGWKTGVRCFHGQRSRAASNRRLVSILRSRATQKREPRLGKLPTVGLGVSRDSGAKGSKHQDCSDGRRAEAERPSLRGVRGRETLEEQGSSVGNSNRAGSTCVRSLDAVSSPNRTQLHPWRSRNSGSVWSTADAVLAVPLASCSFRGWLRGHVEERRNRQRRNTKFSEKRGPSPHLVS